jgi:hypothetical protein
MKSLGLTLLATAIVVAAGCAATASSESDAQEIRQLERRALGAAVPYPADPLTAADDTRFATSKKARRDLGWRVLAKALAPVATAAPTARTIPLFRTWLGGDEFSRMFAKMYEDLGPSRRAAKDVPTPAELDALFAWNATSLGPSSEADYFARLEALRDQASVDGLGGNARVGFSPGFVRALLSDHPTLAACNLTSLAFDTPPQSDSNFTNCLSRELPPDAAVIKASWRRNDAVVAGGLPVMDTSAATLAKTMGEGDGAWNVRDAPRVPAGPRDAYTVTLSDATTYSLVGLHLMTKELRHWVWVTVWWSAEPDTDFGEDRPEAIKKLGAPWDRYKMCVVTDYDERDPDPRGGQGGTLGDALAAVHGPSSWCSNPFIERGAHNAQTNCIGCHQHAGDIAALDPVLTDPERFPRAGRTLLRKAFPADYSWAVATPASPDTRDRLRDVIVERMQLYGVTP